MSSYTVLPPLDGIDEVRVRREIDGAIIPADARNVDWQAYLAWRAEATEAPAGTAAPAT